MRRLRGKVAECQVYIVVIAINLEHPVDRLADHAELIERGFGQSLLQYAIDIGDQDDEPGVQRLYGPPRLGGCLLT